MYGELCVWCGMVCRGVCGDRTQIAVHSVVGCDNQAYCDTVVGLVTGWLMAGWLVAIEGVVVRNVTATRQRITARREQSGSTPARQRQ